MAVDITDAGNREWWDKYKYDIPVLHIAAPGSIPVYMAKHRLTKEEALAALQGCIAGTFESPRGEPNAAKLER